MYRLLLLLLTIAHLTNGASQSIHENYSSPLSRTEKKDVFFLSLEHVQFFKNNEYFHVIYEGYTLPGYHLTPLASYIIDENTYVQGGIFITQFYGQSGFYRVLPIARIHHRFSSTFSATLGYLDGSLRHQLPDPVHHFDRYFFHPVETGVQLRYTGKAFTSDTWIDWEEFILWGDDAQEAFTFGSNNKVTLLSEHPRLQLEIPLCILMYHRGGQINETESPMVNLLNFHSGLRASIAVGSEWLQAIEPGVLIMYYDDLSPTPMQAFTSGHAAYPYLAFTNNFSSLRFAYWEANRFLAPKGNPLFHSASQYTTNTLTNRQLLHTQLNLYRYFDSGFTMGANVELFYDVKHKIPDYHFGFYFSFHRDFFFRKG